MKRPRVAMVVQRAGLEVNGGAEALCRDVALAMSAVWDVTIITTTARDYTSWEPYYRPGEDTLGDVRIQRFDVDAPRDTAHFDALSARIVGQSSATLDKQEAWMRAQGPYSTKLLRYIEDEAASFDCFIFYTYLYATTYFGLPLVGEKAILAPFAHPEWMIELPMWNAFFRLPRKILFSTPEERDFLTRRFPDAALSGPVIGVGVAPPTDIAPEAFRARFKLPKRYALYVGRVDVAKRCDHLVAEFAAYKNRFSSELELVFVGRVSMELPKLPYVQALGYLEEGDKFAALAASELLIMPSALESLSIVLLEAWSVGRPVLVCAESDVLVGQCRRANAGLWYSDEAEFAAALNLLSGEVSGELGAAGERFVRQNYSWSSIVAAYEQLYAQTF